MDFNSLIGAQFTPDMPSKCCKLPVRPEILLVNRPGGLEPQLYMQMLILIQKNELLLFGDFSFESEETIAYCISFIHTHVKKRKQWDVYPFPFHSTLLFTILWH